jgi:hypothetical protein
LGARLLGKAPRLAVASPVYLAHRGTPQTLADLVRHDCILGPGLSGRTGWSFTRSGRATSVNVDGKIKVASADGVVACQSGARNSGRLSMDVSGRTRGRGARRNPLRLST